MIADTNGSRYTLDSVAEAIGTFPSTRLLEPLRNLLSEDLRRWRAEKEEFKATFARGGRPDPASGARMSYAIRYGQNMLSLINVEITESAIIKNLELAQRTLDLVKRYGIGVQIDDFGTGYSSLSLLKDLPLDALKIDKSFVQGIVIEPGAKSIVQAVVELSKTLGFRTIAEGVETEEQAVMLRDIGVNYLQGYYFSRPVGASEFVVWLAKTGVHLVA